MKFFLITMIICSLGVLTAAAGKASCSTGESTFDLSIKLDEYPNEDQWTIYDYNYNIIYSENLGNELANQMVKRTICFPPKTPDCYYFEINDKAWDGICCEWGKGSYSYTYKSADKNTKSVSVKRSGDFGGADVTLFGNCGSSPLPLDRLKATTISVTNNIGLPFDYESNQNAFMIQFPFNITYLQGVNTGVTNIDYKFDKKYFIDKLILTSFACSAFDSFRVGVSIDKKDNYQWVFTDTNWSGVSERTLEVFVKTIGNNLRIELVNGVNDCDGLSDLTRFGFWKVVIFGYHKDNVAPTPVPKQIKTKAPVAPKAPKRLAK